MRRVFKYFIGVLLSFVVLSIVFIFITAQPLVSYDLKEFDVASDLVEPLEGVTVVDTLPKGWEGLRGEPLDIGEIPLFLLLATRGQRVYDEQFIPFQNAWEIPWAKDLWASYLLEPPSSYVVSISENWSSFYNHISWSEGCEIIVHKIELDVELSHIDRMDMVVQKEWERLFKTAKNYNQRLHNFFLQAANEIKRNNCAADSVDIAQKWAERVAAYRLETKNGRVFGLAWNPTGSWRLNWLTFKSAFPADFIFLYSNILGIDADFGSPS